MEYLVGVGLALAVSAMASGVGLDRDRAFYPTLMIVIALYYGLFAVVGGSMQALATESVFIVAFVLVAILGFKRNLWIVAGALIAHGLFDLFHGHLISNPGVPAWWPMFCLTYDVAAGAYLAWLLKRSRVAAKAL
jgi:hypothetical protein